MDPKVPGGEGEQLPTEAPGMHVPSPPLVSPPLTPGERLVIVATIRSGPSGQIWDLIGKLKKSTYYGLVEIGPVGGEDL